jgi:GH15 family glucan-1,4-alpha-glucosidase
MFQAPARQDRFIASSVDPEIGDYAIIGDCRTAALVSRTGSIDWLCLPHFSGPSIFAALLDRERGGRFSIKPSQEFLSSRRYLPATPVLETTFHTRFGIARLTDLMPVVNVADGLAPMREILRVVEGVEGSVTLDIQFVPRPNYARKRACIRSRGALGWACSWGDEVLLLASEAQVELAPDGVAVTGRVRVRAGERLCFSLTYTKGDIGIIAPLGKHAEERLQATVVWWSNWTGRSTYQGPYKEAVERSAITLKLMTFALSGAVVAAPTTSLPETVGADRNWDYRYCWLRDAALTMRAFTGLGYQAEAGSFLHWLLHATRLTWPRLQIMYDIHGRTNLREEELEHLSGYRGSRPVRIGNDANTQVQLDVYGEVVSAAYYYVQSGGQLQADEAKLLAGFGETVCKHWREPDNGIWEIRGAKRQYTFSKVMCWAALDSLIKLHEQGHVRGNLDHHHREREAIAGIIETHGFNKALASYTSELDGDRLDAAVLLMGCLGYKDPAHPRMRATFDRIRERLRCDGLLYRYEQGVDGLDAPEGAFGICSFWAIDNLAKRGDVTAATEAFEHILSFANDVGLYAEEIDVATGAALGNFPQAFTHVGLINAAMALAGPQKTAAGLPPFWSMMIWGLVATVAMTTILQGAQGLGFSRLSLPFLAGTFFTGDRRWALIVGFTFYVIGGWLFAFLYFVLFASFGLYTWWLGALTGLLHGLFLLVCGLPLLPYIHPRMASEYDGASTIRQLEPPGFMGMNYGPRTPLTTLAGQAVYGAVLGGLPQMILG